MKKVLIINEGFSNNFGDQMINKSMTELFENNNYETDYMYFSQPSLYMLPKYTYLEPVYKDSSNTKSLLAQSKSLAYILYWVHKNKKAIIKQLTKKEYDTIVFGGGQLINTSGRLSPNQFSISLYFIQKYIKKYCKAKVFLISVGCASRFNSLELFFYKNAFKNIDAIWVRDNFSKESFKNVFNKNAKVIPDIAFYNPLENQNFISKKKKIALIGITNYKEVYLKYNSNGLSREEYYDEYYKRMINYKRQGLSSSLFYTTLSDAFECLEFQKYILTKYNEEVEIVKINSLNDLILSLKTSSQVFSGRMHALILGLKYHCNVEAFLLSQKLISFNNDYIKSKNTLEILNSQIENGLKQIFVNEK